MAALAVTVFHLGFHQWALLGSMLGGFLLMAYATWRWVETPILQRLRPRKFLDASVAKERVFAGSPISTA